MKQIKLIAAAIALSALAAGPALAGDIQAGLETRGGPNPHAVNCPHTVVFQGAISSRVTGLVQYRIVRSTGELSPVKSITFNRPGNRLIQSAQTVDSSGRGWQRIEVLFPREVKSKRAWYHLICTRGRPRPPAPRPNPGNPVPPPPPPAPRPAPPDPSPRPPRVGEDCVSFNPHRLHVEKRGRSFYLVESSHQVAHFGGREGEARRSLEIIRHLRMNRLCFVGRPGSKFQYLLSSGSAPSGRLAGQDCLGFDPARLRVRKIGGSYKIVDNGRYLFDFGPDKGSALKALEIIQRHGFRRSCFVGRPGPSFSYLLR